MKYLNISIISTLVVLFTTACSSSSQDESIKLKPYNMAPLSERAPQSISLHRPFDFPLLLSGNFGELRANHFHGGIDFKTQGTVGHPIHCADDGYVSQISVSGGGFGRAIYVTHPATGLTTVYGHLDDFAPDIKSIVTARQYELETFAITMRFPADKIPVKKGDIIAFSGNSGYSFGPHLHMEVRHTASGDALDPLPYFKEHISDNVAPSSQALILYPHKDEGRVNGTKNAVYVNTSPGFTPNFYAWGKVYPAIRANDYMTDSHNIYGVKHLVLKVDGNEVYRRTIDRFHIASTRAINTLVDYKDLNTTDNWNMYTHIPQSKPLGCMIESSLEGGAVNINEQRAYKCEFIMTDEYGNSSTVPFIINGIKTNIEPVATALGKLIKHNSIDTISSGGLTLKFYEGSFYDDTHVEVKQQESKWFNTPLYSIGNPAIPMARSYRMAIKLTNDTLSDKSKYCIVRVNGSYLGAITSRYNNGEMVGYASRMGDYAVTTDLQAPTINAINVHSWGSYGVITFSISDNLSGIKSYRGTIDGKWVMFEADNKNSLVAFKLTPDKVEKGGNHEVTLTVTDNCGNTNTKTHKFVW